MAWKQLKEHLKDEQEPFTLNIYLSERGCLVKCLSSNGRNGGCCQSSLFKNLWNNKMVLTSTRLVKSVLYKLVSAGNNDHDSLELPCCSQDNKGIEDEFQNIEDYHSSSQASSYMGNYLEQQKTFTNGTCQNYECVRDKQIDHLMSMLNKLSSEKVHHIIARQESPSSRNAMDRPIENVKGNFVLATFPWKLLGKSLMERYTLIGFKETKATTSIINQELGSQRKPLFNNLSTKKINYNDGTNVGNKYKYIHWFIGLKNMGNLTGADQIYTCSRDKLSSHGFFDSFEEWPYSKLKRKIGFELGDTIMDEIIEEVIYL